MNGKHLRTAKLHVAKRAQIAARIDRLRLDGASCATCGHFDARILAMRSGPTCSLQSGGNEYVVVKQDGLCAGWEVRANDD